MELNLDSKLQIEVLKQENAQLLSEISLLKSQLNSLASNNFLETKITSLAKIINSVYLDLMDLLSLNSETEMIADKLSFLKEKYGCSTKEIVKTVEILNSKTSQLLR